MNTIIIDEKGRNRIVEYMDGIDEPYVGVDFKQLHFIFDEIKIIMPDVGLKAKITLTDGFSSGNIQINKKERWPLNFVGNMIFDYKYDGDKFHFSNSIDNTSIDDEEDFFDAAIELTNLYIAYMFVILDMSKKRSQIVKEYVPSKNVSNKESQNDMSPKKAVRKNVFLLDEIIEYAAQQNIVYQHRTHTINCEAWSVRGHYRKYKSGKVVFIKSFVKGKNRDKAQPQDRNYII